MEKAKKKKSKNGEASNKKLKSLKGTGTLTGHQPSDGGAGNPYGKKKSGVNIL